MWDDFPLFPVQASTLAARVDALYFFLLGVSLFFSVLISALVIYFSVRYRRRAVDEVGAPITGSLRLEILWSIVPLGIGLFVFGWGASLFFSLSRPPASAMDVYVVGKQWMWKVQHLDGTREINELHVPVGRPVRLTMGSEDVIHSFYVPAFRVKADVVPGRLTTLWFEATRPGRYHLFCAEYCGTQHSGMVGSVVAMEPSAFQAWLAGGMSEGSLAAQGARLFRDLACNTCHLEETQGRGPMLGGLFGREALLASGETVVVDENYVRESIVDPRAKVVAGFVPLMPTFQGQVSEEGLLALIAYIQSLGDTPGTPAPATEPPPGAAATDDPRNPS